MLNFKMGSISLDEVVEGKEITKTIYGPLKRKETISALSPNKGYIVTTEKHSDEVELRRHYRLEKGNLELVHPRFYNPITNRFYN